MAENNFTPKAPRHKVQTVEAYDDHAVGRLSDMEQGQVVQKMFFKDTDTISFEQLSSNEMCVRIRGVALPPFDGVMFSSEFLDYLEKANLIPAVDYIREEAFKATEHYMLINEMLKARTR